MESDKTGVLIFVDWYLPGYKAGGPIRSCANLVENLREYYHFRVVTGDRDYLDTRPYDNLPVDQWVESRNCRVCYLPPEKRTLKRYRDLLAEFPGYRVYINGIFSKDFSIFPLIAARQLNRDVIMAPRGMLAPGALSIKPGRKKFYLQLAKTLGWFKRVRFHATHPGEAEQIKVNIHRQNKIHVIPNLPEVCISEKNLPTPWENTLNLLCVARIAPEKNTIFALECLRKIPADLKINFTWIGPVYNPEYYRQCLGVIASLPENVSVDFPGAIPPSGITAYHRKSHLFFLPTLGENYGHAIIESLLSDTPVLISDQTPWQHLEKHGLGAALPLSDHQAFSRYIEKIARLDRASYFDTFDGISEKAKTMIQLPETIEKYKKLFACGK